MHKEAPFPYALPQGYYATRSIVTGVSRLAFCHCPSQGIFRVLKAPKVDQGEERRAISHLLHEANVLNLIGPHPNIVPLAGVGLFECQDIPYLELDWVDPTSQDSSITYRLARGYPLGIQNALRVALQISSVMMDAQNAIPGLAHGDIKPANILVTHGRAALTDFGIAMSEKLAHQQLQDNPDRAFLSRNTVETHCQFPGTAYYRAPELWRRQSLPTMASDVYAFGCTLFEMTTATPLFQAKHTDALEVAHKEARAAPFPIGYPESLRALIDKATMNDPQARYQSWSAVKKDILELSQRDTIERIQCTGPAERSQERSGTIAEFLGDIYVSLNSDVQAMEQYLYALQYFVSDLDHDTELKNSADATEGKNYIESLLLRTTVIINQLLTCNRFYESLRYCFLLIKITILDNNHDAAINWLQAARVIVSRFDLYDLNAEISKLASFLATRDSGSRHINR